MATMHTSMFKIVKVPLRDIVTDPNHMNVLNSTAETVHAIIEYGMDLLKLALLETRARNGEFQKMAPIIEIGKIPTKFKDGPNRVNFVEQCLYTVCLPKRRPQKCILDDLLDKGTHQDSHEIRQLRRDLADIYYSRCSHSQPHVPDRSGLNSILDYAITQIVTAYSNNIIAHIRKHVQMYVVARHAHEFELISDHKTMKSPEKQAAKRALTYQLCKVTSDILLGNNSESEWSSNEKYHNFLIAEVPTLMPPGKFEVKGGLNLQAEKDPSSFLNGMCKMSDFLLSMGRKSLVVFPTTTGSYAAHFTLDTTGLKQLIPRPRRKSGDPPHPPDAKRWDEIFKKGHNHFHQFNADYTFHNQIQTDGVAVSILYVRRDAPSKKRNNPKKRKSRNKKAAGEKKEALSEQYIEDYVQTLSQEEREDLSLKDLIAVDPGLKPIAYMVNSPDSTAKVFNTRIRRRIERKMQSIRPKAERRNIRSKSKRKYKNRRSRANKRRKGNAAAAQANTTKPPEPPAAAAASAGTVDVLVVPGKNKRRKGNAAAAQANTTNPPEPPAAAAASAGTVHVRGLPGTADVVSRQCDKLGTAVTPNSIESSTAIRLAISNKMFDAEVLAHPIQVPQVRHTISQDQRRKGLNLNRHKFIRKRVNAQFVNALRLSGSELYKPTPPPPSADGDWSAAGLHGLEVAATVEELQGSLGAFNSKTCDVEKFAAFVRAKNFVRQQLRSLNNMKVFRKLNFSAYIRKQKMETILVNEFKKSFGHQNGERLVVCWGDWNKRSQHHNRYNEPVPNIGLRRLLRRHGFQVYLVKEYLTSQRCSSCESTSSVVKPFRYVKDPRNSKKRMRARAEGLKIPNLKCNNLTRCSACGMLWNRDGNAASNIWKIADAAIRGEPRPEFLCYVK